MRKIKIVKGFYDVKMAGKVKRSQIRIAKGAGMAGAEVVVEDAHSFYMKNGWFRRQRQFKTRPVPGEKMVVIYYDEVRELIKKVSKVKRTVKAEVKIEVAEDIMVKDLRSMFAPLMPNRSEKRTGTSVSPSMIFRMEGQLITETIVKNKCITLSDTAMSHALAA